MKILHQIKLLAPTREPVLLAWMRPVVLAALLVVPAGLAVSQPVTLGDASGRTATIESASRIVALGGSVTETLYALGLAASVTAIDTTSLFPPEALTSKPNVGYLRALSAEGILSLEPSLVLAEADAGPPQAIALLEGASVPFLRVPDEKTPAGVADKIRFIGKAVGHQEDAAAMAAALEADFATVENALANVKPVRALFILSLSNGRIMAAGAGTAADAMLRLAGAENALPGFSGYKPVTAEAVLTAAPEAIVMMARRGSGPGPGFAVADVLADPTLAETPAGKTGRIVAMEALYLLGFGPRAAHAAHDLAAALHPELTLPVLPDRPWTKAAAASQ